MTGNSFSGMTLENLLAARAEAQERLLSLAAAVASPDGTSVRMREQEEIEQMIAKLNAAIDVEQTGRPRRRVGRLNFMGYGRFRRWMR